VTGARVPFVGLTGAVAAGKSEALAACERLGAITISADAVVHELLTDPAIIEAAAGRLGSQVIVDGKIDRDAIAAVVFRHPELREWWEGTLWPRVGATIWAWREHAQTMAPPPRCAIVEVPLLFEAGMDAGFDATVCVVASDSARRARLSERDHVAVEEREKLQLSSDEKAARADYVVENDRSIADLEAKLDAVLIEVAK